MKTEKLLKENCSNKLQTLLA